MVSDFEGIRSAISGHRLPPTLEELFGDIIDLNEVRFRAQEGLNVDYKHDIPESFTDNHGLSIVRLALGLYNAYGGVIVFGVVDKRLDIQGTTKPFQVEAFNRVLSDFSSSSFETIHQRYALKRGELSLFVDVVLVPQRAMEKPARLTRTLGKFEPGTIFVRDRHEVVQAKAKHLPMLYSAARAIPFGQPDVNVLEVHRSLPPSPSTMKEFVARNALLENLWDWLVFGRKPRLYIYGPGGSEKSTLAFEFATEVAQHGHSLRFEGGQKLDYVIYLSGKETEFNVLNQSRQYFSSKQFSNTREQFVEILYHSGLASRIETLQADEAALLEKLSTLFSEFNGLIVLDDIDALSRRGVDTGEEALFTELVTVNRKTRLLYTLRYPPGHALSSAMQVPGLEFHSEFEPFVSICADQFGTPVPDKSEQQIIFEESDGLPLLIETIIGLRKYSGNYENAIAGFKDRGGDEARRYLYQREYERLDKNGKARQVLAALSLVPEGLQVEELVAVTTATKQQVADALSECGNVFLSIMHDANAGTVYQVSPPALPFIVDISKRVNFFQALEQRIKRFGDEYYRVSAREQEITREIERLLAIKDYFGASQLGDAVAHEGSEASSSPKLRALTGLAFKERGPSFGEKAREHFRFAYQMRYRGTSMLRGWFDLEINSNHGVDEAESICNTVLSEDRFSDLIRSEFSSKLGYCYYVRATKILGVRRENACDWLRRSIDCYMEALWIGEKADRRDVGITLNWLDRPLSRLESASRNDFEQSLLLIEMLADRKHDVHMEGARIISNSLQRWGSSASTDSRHRAIGRTSKVLAKIRKNFPDLDQNVGFRIIFTAITSVKIQLESISDSTT